MARGLAYPIARTIVETYGGKIWAENRPGGGAVFRFTLPLSSGSNLTFESWKGFPSGSLHASLAHANRNFHYSQAC